MEAYGTVSHGKQASGRQLDRHLYTALGEALSGRRITSHSTTAMQV